jgi:uncharacterized Ntn-hydrolase superfamily protein
LGQTNFKGYYINCIVRGHHLTYSIVARDAATGSLGIAVASRFFAVGSLVPHICNNAAIATQAFVNPMWGVEGKRRLLGGESAETVMADFINRDAGQAIRQAHMIDAMGVSVAHTGANCIDWAGHRIADGVSVAGNMLVGPEVVDQTLMCFQDSANLPFAERLLTAMEAGEAAGGDKRGRQAAALLVHHAQDYPILDLRVDDHADPLSELRRLHSVAQERAVHFANTFATDENFSGTIDRTELDRSIIEREAQMAKSDYVSSSFATTVPS